VPDHTTLSRRAATLEVPQPRSSRSTDAGKGAQPVRLLVDSTGLKLCGPGEWLIEKHGTRMRRSWRKFHLGVDANTGRIMATALTAPEADDGPRSAPCWTRSRATVRMIRNPARPFSIGALAPPYLFVRRGLSSISPKALLWTGGRKGVGKGLLAEGTVGGRSRGGRNSEREPRLAARVTGATDQPMAAGPDHAAPPGQEVAVHARLGAWSLALGLTLGVIGCAPDDVPGLRERAQQAWSEVLSQYSERADQVPPLVEAVRRKAPGEREVLDEVMAAHDEVVAIRNADRFLAEPERFRHYEEAQQRLSVALERLYATIKRYSRTHWRLGHSEPPARVPGSGGSASGGPE
jgi:hypothetical protein